VVLIQMRMKRMIESRLRGEAFDARPCVDLIDLDSYLAALDGLDISIVRDSAHA